MKYKNLLVHLDHSSGCRNRLQVAFQLARSYDSQLLGLFIVPTYIVPSYVEAQVSTDLLNEVTEKALARAREAADEYAQQARQSGVELQTAVIEGAYIPILREHSKYADLLILGQDDPDDPDNTSYGLADELLFDGACPCLVVPHSGKLTTPGKRVLLAWNASRESARALRDSIPLLQRADEVVALISEPDGAARDPDNRHPHTDALLKRLSAHGIDARHCGLAGLEPGEAIIAQAAEMNADLIVMGAYGHARLREIILGGVTRELLKRAPTCLLLAH